MIIAGMDLGTNTFRLLVVKANAEAHLEPLASEQKILRLGEGLQGHRRLQPCAVRRALEVLREFRQILDHFRVDHVVAVATSAVREAVNGPDFVEAIRSETKIEVEVISPAEEARRTLLGVLTGFQEEAPRVLVVDIGGGSTEFAWGDRERLHGWLSSDLGVVRLTERFLCGPPTPEAMERLRNEILDRVSRVREACRQWASQGTFRFFGTAGTVTTLAAVDLALKVYDPRKIQMHRMDLSVVGRLVERLASRTPAERLEISGIEKGREDLILPGGMILLLTMQSLEIPEVVVSEYGLREGIIADFFAKRFEKTIFWGSPAV